MLGEVPAVASAPDLAKPGRSAATSAATCSNGRVPTRSPGRCRWWPTPQATVQACWTSTSASTAPAVLPPARLPTWESVYGCFATWQAEGVFAWLTGLLRRLVRKPKDAMPSRAYACSTPRARRPPRTCRSPGRASTPARGPSTADAASGWTSPTSCQPVLVAAASVLRRYRRHSPAPTDRRHPPADHQSSGRHRLPHRAIGYNARRGIDAEVTRPDPRPKGFPAILRRRVIERTFGQLMHHRCLAHDYKTHPHRIEAMIRFAMFDLMSRRLARGGPPNRHEPKLPIQKPR